MRFKFWIAALVFTAAGTSAMGQNTPGKEAAAGFFGALLKGIVSVPGEGSADSKNSHQGRKKDPLSGNPIFYEGDIEPINSKALAIRPPGSVKYEDNLNACWAAAKEVTGLNFRASGAPEFCLRRLSAETKSDIEKKQAASAAAFIKEREDRETNRVAAQVSMREQSEAIARRIEAGDASAWRNCSVDPSGSHTSVEFYNTCVPIAEPAFIRALRAKRFPPDNCRKWGLANTHEGETLSSAMRVSIGSDGKLGSFSGEVTQIDGKTIALYNRDTRSNAIAVIDGKTQVFNGDQVAVGLAVYGVGIQTSTRQVKLASGLASSVAVISAKCIGDF